MQPLFVAVAFKYPTVHAIAKIPDMDSKQEAGVPTSAELDMALEKSTSDSERCCIRVLRDNPAAVKEAADNRIEIPNDAKSVDIIKSIVGEYRQWFSATKISVAERENRGYAPHQTVTYCKSMAKMQSGSVMSPNYKLFVDVWVDHGDRLVKIDEGRFSNWGPGVEIPFKTRGELRSAIESVWMAYATFLGA